jgi:hypothetical protein
MSLSTTGLRLAADAAIDLLLHTAYSDGLWTPEALLDHLRRERFGLAAITDHDRADTAVLAQPSAQQPHALVALLKAHGHGLGNPPAGKLVMAAGCTFVTNDPAAVVEAAHQSGGGMLAGSPGSGSRVYDF